MLMYLNVWILERDNMTDLQVISALTRSMNTVQAGLPATTLTLTISSVSANTVQFTENIGASNLWNFGVLEVTSGTAIGIRAIVARSHIDYVEVYESFKVSAPSVGDTVKLSAGPLKNSRIYMFEPIGAGQDYTNGYRYFIATDFTSGEVDNTGLSTLDLGANYISLETLVFSPLALGSTPGNLADVREALYGLPTLRSQVVAMIFDFRRQEQNRIQGAGSIRYQYTGVEIDGVPPSKCAILSYDLKIR